MNDKNSVEVDTVLESSNAYALKEARRMEESVISSLGEIEIDLEKIEKKIKNMLDEIKLIS